MDNKKKVVVILFVLAIVFSVGSILISMDILPGFGNDEMNKPDGVANVGLIVEEDLVVEEGDIENG